MFKRLIWVLFIVLVRLSFGTLVRMNYEFGGQTYHKFTRGLVKDNFGISLFEEPYDGVAYNIADTGFCFVADAMWHRVIYARGCETDEEHYYTKSFGTWGSGARQFKSPHGVAIDDNRDIYIADTDNGRVVKLRLQSDTLAWIDEIGEAYLQHPWDLEVEGNKLYVIDAGLHKVFRFSLSGNYEVSYGGYGFTQGKFNEPKGIAISGNHIYISDTDNQRVVALKDRRTYFEFLKWLYPDLSENVYLLDIEVDQRGVIYACDGARSKIIKFSPNLTSHCYSFGCYGAGVNQFKHPRGIFIQDTTIAIVEEWTDNSGIQAYKEVVKIKELKTSKQAFDATEQDITISFKIDDFSAGAELTVGDREWNFTNLNPDEEYQVVWDGRHRNDSLFLPGNYIIHLSLSEGDTWQKTIKVKGTKIGGHIYSDTTWIEEGEPYVMIGQVTIRNDSKLTIEPGVKVMPSGNFALVVWLNSSLIAKGSPINKILFTPYRKLYPEPDPVTNGSWKWICFNNQHSAAENDTLLLKHCIIEASGSNNAAIDIKDYGRVIIDNCEILKSGGYGYYESDIRIQNTLNRTTKITNSVFKDNDSLPMKVAFASIGEVNNNTFENNYVQAIEVVASTRKNSGTIANQGVPYWFIAERYETPNFWFNLRSGTTDSCITLTIDPGTQMFFEDEAYISCGWRGNIIAQGEINDSIIFTALDTIVGWRGIENNCANDDDTSKFEYCEISYVDYYHALLSGGHRPLVVKNSTIAHNRRLGIKLKSGGNDLSVCPIVEDNTFYCNDSFPIALKANALRNLKNNVFLDEESDFDKIMKSNNHNIGQSVLNNPPKDLLVNEYGFRNLANNNGIYVYGERINRSFSFDYPGIPLLIEDITIEGYGDTIVVLKLNSGNWLIGGNISIRSNGGFKATGTKFGKSDDTYSWQGINFESCLSDSCCLDSCIIQGDNYLIDLAIYINNASPVIKDSKIFNNRYGVAIIGGNSFPLLERNLISLNQCGIHNMTNGSTNLSLHNNDFCGNKIAIKNEMESNHVDAISNWWGDASGPWDPTDTIPGPPDYNPAGWGDSIGDYVQYRPWLESPVHGQVVTLIQPNGGEILYAESNYEIQWLIEPGRDLPQILRQELYYTIDFPEGGARDQALWQFIDTVDVNQTSYVWNVASIPSARCRVAIKVYYDDGKSQAPNSKSQTMSNCKKTDYTDTSLKALLQNTQIKGKKATEGNLGQLRTDEIASPLDKLGTRNDTFTLTFSHQGRGDMVENLFDQERGEKTGLLAMTDYEYEGRGTNTISIDISDANFTIVDTVSPQITLIAPNGGEYFIPTKAETIKWQASDNHKLDHFNIYLSTDGGTNYSTTIIQGLEAPCSTYAWIPSEENSYKCKVKIVAYDSSDNYNDDVSDDLFYIPVKSYSNEMTAYNNARRLVRSFFSNLRLVYTTQEDTETEGQGDKKMERQGDEEIWRQGDKLQMTNDKCQMNDKDQRSNNQCSGLIYQTKDEIASSSAKKYGGLLAMTGARSGTLLGYGRGTSKVYYTHSTNMGQNWSDPIELGNGIYPSITMDQNPPSKIGVAWTNVSGSKVLYKYCNPFGIWSGLYTIFNEASDITYSPVAIQFAKDSIHLVSLRTTRITSSELVQDVLYHKFPWTDPGACATMETIDHWRIVYDGPLPNFVSIAVDYDGIAHLAWEGPPGDTMFTTPTPFDIFYALRGRLLISDKYNISNSDDDNSIHPSADCYGGHCYVVWQEKVNGYNVFLYKRNYVQFPPNPETDTISQTSGNSVYPVSRMGGVVLWAEGDPAEIYGRIWNSKKEYWLEIENWSNTPDNSMYPQVDAWHNMGSTDIIGAWTENTDTCGLGKRFVSFWPSKDHADISFPSYCLTLGDSMSTPFTEYRDTIATYQEDKFDLGVDSLVYYLPYINANAQCRIMIELYRPDVSEGSTPGKENKPKGSTPNKDSNWKLRLNLDGIMHRIIKLAPGELKTLEFNAPWLVNINGSARIKFKKMRGDFILVRRILFYEYERGEKDTGSFLAGGGPQSDEIMQVSPVFFECIYPNPARGNLRIRFNSPDEQKVTIKLYDVSGRLINEIFNGKTKIGMNEMPIMAENYAAGIYFIRIETDKEIITEKFIMLK